MFDLEQRYADRVRADTDGRPKYGTNRGICLSNETTERIHLSEEYSTPVTTFQRNEQRINKQIKQSTTADTGPGTLKCLP